MKLVPFDEAMPVNRVLWRLLPSIENILQAGFQTKHAAPRSISSPTCCDFAVGQPMNTYGHRTNAITTATRITTMTGAISQHGKPTSVPLLVLRKKPRPQGQCEGRGISTQMERPTRSNKTATPAQSKIAVTDEGFMANNFRSLYRDAAALLTNSKLSQPRLENILQ